MAKKLKRKKRKMKAKQKRKTVLKVLKRDPLKLLNLKISGKDRRRLEIQAKKYANGNLSAWLRYAGSHFVPKKSELIA